MTNTFTMLRLLPVSDRDKDAEILYALREFEDFYNRHRPHQGIANAAR